VAGTHSSGRCCMNANRESHRALGRRRGLPHEHQDTPDLVARVLACEAREAVWLGCVAQGATRGDESWTRRDGNV